MNNWDGRWFWAGAFLVGLAGVGACSDDDPQAAAGSGAGRGGSASTKGGAGSTSGGSTTKPSGGGGSGGVGTGGTPMEGGEAGAGGDAGAVGNAGTGGAAGAGGADNGGQSTGGAAGDGGASGEGGTGLGGDAGLCDDPDSIVSTLLPSCALTNNEPTCRGCLKTKTCQEWQACYGDQPRSACGYATKVEDAGQFDCIVFCFADGASGSTTPDDLLEACANSCENQCTAINADTSALLETAYERCTEECFPF